MSQSQAVLVAAAPLCWTPGLAQLAGDAAPLLAADGGADHLARIGLRAEAVIGDLDSISDETRAWLGEGALRHRPDQDRTDLDKALDFAFRELHLDELKVLAALGGRPDHDLANLGALARLALGDRLAFIADDYRVMATNGELELPALVGETWSFWTFDPGVLVTLDGVRWPVHSEPLVAFARPSISNQAVSDRVFVNASNGAVVICRHTQSLRG